jgi:hypothetical protein
MRKGIVPLSSVRSDNAGLFATESTENTEKEAQTSVFSVAKKGDNAQRGDYRNGDIDELL